MSDQPEKTGQKQEIRDEKGRFIEGVSGNPSGRPIGRFSLTSRMIKRLEEDSEETEAILDWLIANRKDLVWNKIDPNPPTDLNLRGDGELPFLIKIMKDDRNPNEGANG